MSVISFLAQYQLDIMMVLSGICGATETATTTAADGTKTTVVTTEKAVETTDGTPARSSATRAVRS